MDLFFELIQVAVGTRERLSRVPDTHEWETLLELARQHTLEGVMLDGVERLPREQMPDLDMKLDWIGETMFIEEENKVKNRRTEKIVRLLKKDGFECVVLKGQGLAQLYPNPLRRMSGDIDVWITSHSRDEVVKYLKGKGFDGRVVYHNVPVHCFKKTEVEVHFTPSWMNSWFENRKLQHWFGMMKDKTEVTTLSTGEQIPVPCEAFNLVFVLQHIYRHLFGSGIGLRQLMDYYYVLRQLKDKREKINVVETLRSLNMMKFTSAVMWVLKEVMGLSEEWMLCGPNEKEGRWLLSEILLAGNFGHYDDRISIPNNETKIHSFLRITKQNIRLLGHYPEETIWNPAYRAWHYCWRKVKGYPV